MLSFELYSLVFGATVGCALYLEAFVFAVERLSNLFTFFPLFFFSFAQIFGSDLA